MCVHVNVIVYACGFYRQHRGKVTGVCYSPSGDHMYTSGAEGNLVMYMCNAENRYKLLRVLANTVVRNDTYGPDALAMSPDGRFLAFVGPSQFTVSVVCASTLDEALRIDVASINADTTRTELDTALRVAYSVGSVRHLLVSTTSNRLFKFNARTGQIASTVSCRSCSLLVELSCFCFWFFCLHKHYMCIIFMLNES